MTTATLPQPLADSPAAGRIEELGRIIMAYSEVTERLQQSHEQLNETVLALRQELNEKNRLLERKNRLAALGEMAAGMAHEIRNPLGGIQLYASMLAKDVAGKPDCLATVKKISAGVKRLEALVSQVLQFSREIVAAPQPMDLAEAVAQAVEYASAKCERHGVACVVDGPAALDVNADPLLIGQAVLNLLLNAAEALGEAGTSNGVVRVTYAAASEDDGAKQFRLCVEDNGTGIPPEAMDKIFNPFFTTKDEGTGLGLAIVHRMVEAHDGTIVVTNGSSGGARFEVRV
jgi:two-component system sensor histidine kinase HydH